MKKLLALILSLNFITLAVAKTNASANGNWHPYANSIAQCSPTALVLPNLNEISFLEAAISMAVEPTEQDKINHYFQNSHNDLTIIG
ncbi:MAG: hypothetical protein P4M14_02980 [Gammaproteobacteria bacterium]|nr:hypothetical protein [Gammaproteobacteria bacterium]